MTVTARTLISPGTSPRSTSRPRPSTCRSRARSPPTSTAATCATGPNPVAPGRPGPPPLVPRHGHGPRRAPPRRARPSGTATASSARPTSPRPSASSPARRPRPRRVRLRGQHERHRPGAGAPTPSSRPAAAPTSSPTSSRRSAPATSTARCPAATPPTRKRDPPTGELHAVSYYWGWGNKVQYTVLGTDARVRAGRRHRGDRQPDDARLRPHREPRRPLRPARACSTSTRGRPRAAPGHRRPWWPKAPACSSASARRPSRWPRR